MARKCFPDAYWKDNTKWWPGYAGQRSVIWDEFGGWSMAPSDYNKIFDRYPHQVETKGGSVALRATNFIIISNFTPGSWWDPTKTRVNIDAVTRRIGAIYWFRVLGEEADEYLDYSEFNAACRGVPFL